MKFWKTLEARERKFLAGLVFFCMLLGIALYVYGYLVRPEGSAFSWIGIISSPDWNVYFMYLRFAAEAFWAFPDLYTLEPQKHLMVNVLWLFLGFLGKIFALSPPAVFHAARILLIPAAIFVIYTIVRAALPEKTGKKYLAMILAIFGSGFGALLFIFMDGHPWSIDVNTVDGWPYWIFMYSPHFAAALILLLGILWFFARAAGEDKLRWSAAAGFLGLVLFNFHPYHFITLYLTAAAGLVFFVNAKGLRLRRAFLHLALFVGLSLPSLVYHGWLAFLDPVIARRHAQNITPVYFPTSVFIAYGLLLIGAIYGIYLLWRSGQESHLRILLAILPLIAIALMLSDLPYGRRFTMGLTIPLGIFTAEAIWLIMPRLRSALCKLPILFLPLAMLFFGSTVHNIALPYILFHGNGREFFQFLTYKDADRGAVLKWLRDQPFGSMRILSHWFMGNVIPGESGQYVFVGHWAETVNYLPKVRAVLRFFNKDVTERERREFIGEHGITHILHSSYEARMGSWDPARADYLTPVFKAGDYTVYEVNHSFAGLQ